MVSPKQLPVEARIAERGNETHTESCLRAAVMAAVDIEHKHEEVKAKFAVGPIRTKK